MKKLDADKVADKVVETLGRDFEHIKILKINVAPGTDPDGNDLLHIEVVFGGALKTADARRIPDVVRRLWFALDVFPLLSFVSKLDYERGHRRETV